MPVAMDFLRLCPMFSGLSAEELTLVAAIVQQQTLPRGTMIFSEGEPAHGFYLVAAGKIKVFKLSADGKERVLHIVPPGRSFAEAAIFDAGSYPAFAQAVTDTQLLVVPKQPFLELLRRHVQLSINIIAGLSRQLRQFTLQIEDLSFRDVPGRLARYLLDLSQGQTWSLALPISKTQLASQLGTTAETLSRTLGKMAAEGIISVRGKEINIIAPARLTELAEQTG